MADDGASLIRLDSLFNNFPANTESKEATWFQGLRFACWGADIAYRRIWRAVEPIMGWTMPEASEPVTVREMPQQSVIEPLVDVWSFIDAAVRIDKFLGVCPLPRITSPRASAGALPGAEFDRVREMFRTASSAAVEMRNHVQHAPTRLDALVSAGRPVWGVLALGMAAERDDATRVVIFSAGAFDEDAFRINMTLVEGGARFSAVREDLDLAALYVAIGEVVDHLEQVLQDALVVHKSKLDVAIGDGGTPPSFPELLLVREYTRRPDRAGGGAAP